MVLATLAGGFSYMFTTFATAADVDEIKAIVIGDSIQRKMWRVCDNPHISHTELKRQIAKERARYREVTGYALDWICTP